MQTLRPLVTPVARARRDRGTAALIAVLCVGAALVGCDTTLDAPLSESPFTEPGPVSSAPASDVSGSPSSGPSDTGDSGTSVVPDASEPTDATQPSGTPNACGGQEPLAWRGSPASLLDPCGEFGEGWLVCNGIDAVRCALEAEVNACGSRGVLPAEPGTRCGCNGIWVCSRGGDLTCSNPTFNACGGCAELLGRPGAVCNLGEGSGTYVCSEDGEGLECRPSAGNGCGGDQPVLRYGVEQAELGEPCETECGLSGVLACAGNNQLDCFFGRSPDIREQEFNPCGGCGRLAGAPNSICGCLNSGTWTCGADGSTVGVRCEPSGAFDEVAPPDSCGGCSGRTAPLYANCDADGVQRGAWQCGAAGVECLDRVPEASRNPCGGAGELQPWSTDRTLMPGDACLSGCPSSGVVICAGPDELDCGSAAGAGPCGACIDALTEDYLPDFRECGACGAGSVRCESTAGEPSPGGGTFFCDMPELSGCGTCSSARRNEQVDLLGQICGECLSLQCNQEGSLRCVPDNSLPGCEP